METTARGQMRVWVITRWGERAAWYVDSTQPTLCASLKSLPAQEKAFDWCRHERRRKLGCLVSIDMSSGVPRALVRRIHWQQQRQRLRQPAALRRDRNYACTK